MVSQFSIPLGPSPKNSMLGTDLEVSFLGGFLAEAQRTKPQVQESEFYIDCLKKTLK